MLSVQRPPTASSTNADRWSHRPHTNATQNGAAAQPKHHVDPPADRSSMALSRFVAERPLPTVVQVVDGCFRNIGVDGDSEIYLHSSTVRTEVVGEALRYDVDARRAGAGSSRLVPASGPAFAMSTDFGGWFELMSEDGRAASAIRQAGELRALIPGGCLVRQNVDALTSPDFDARCRQIEAGQSLSLVGVVTSGDERRSRRLLQCLDADGRSVFLPFEQRGLFSPIVDRHGRGSVGRLSAILADFRLPVVVRLIHGRLPKQLDTAAGGCSSGIFRLIKAESVRTTFVLPLRHAWSSSSSSGGSRVDERSLVSVPDDAARKLGVVGAARDFYQHWLDSNDGLELSRRCNQLIAATRSGAGGVRLLPNGVLAAIPRRPQPPMTAADDAAWSTGPVSIVVSPGRRGSFDSGTASGLSAGSSGHEDHDELFQEIDAIYSAIRYGGMIAVRPVNTTTGRSRSKSADLTATDRPRLSAFAQQNPDRNPYDHQMSTISRGAVYFRSPTRRPNATPTNYADLSAVAVRCRRGRHSIAIDLDQPTPSGSRTTAESTAGSTHRCHKSESCPDAFAAAAVAAAAAAVAGGGGGQSSDETFDEPKLPEEVCSVGLYPTQFKSRRSSLAAVIDGYRQSDSDDITPETGRSRRSSLAAIASTSVTAAAVAVGSAHNSRDGSRSPSPLPPTLPRRPRSASADALLFVRTTPPKASSSPKRSVGGGDERSADGSAAVSNPSTSAAPKKNKSGRHSPRRLPKAVGTLSSFSRSVVGALRRIGGGKRSTEPPVMDASSSTTHGASDDQQGGGAGFAVFYDDDDDDGDGEYWTGEPNAAFETARSRRSWAVGRDRGRRPGDDARQRSSVAPPTPAHGDARPSKNAKATTTTTTKFGGKQSAEIEENCCGHYTNVGVF